MVDEFRKSFGNEFPADLQPIVPLGTVNRADNVLSFAWRRKGTVICPVKA
jgi:hypothetical protein